MFLILKDFLVGFLINFSLIILFYRIPIMTKGGWFSAGILGTILWGCLSWEGWLSVVIYLVLGSLVTKIGFKYKNKNGIAEKRSGRRGPENVWGSASTGLFFAILIKLNFTDLTLLKIAFASSFTAKLADTFGSEIGKRFGRNTFLITTLKKVKRGTEGGISLAGTLASFSGALIMSYVMLILSIITSWTHFLFVAISGILATTFESIIGAQFQDRYKLTNEIVNTIQTSISSSLSIIFYLIFIKFIIS